MWLRRKAGFAFLALAVFLGAQCATTPAKDTYPLDVTPMKNSTAGGLDLVHPLLPDNTVHYLSCEAVLFGYDGASTPLFRVRLADSPATDGKYWHTTYNGYSYTWNYDEGIRVAFLAVPVEEGLHLTYTVTNTSQAPMERVLLHTCIPTTHAPAFFPGFTESDVHEPNASGNYMGFYDRTFLWSGNERFAVGNTEMGQTEIHLSFNRAGARPVDWGWWENGPETFDLPLIAVESKDGQFTTALGFERAEWASCNGGDDRACFHLFPNFGDLAPGESSTVSGCFYVMHGTANDALERFKRDFKYVLP